MTKYWLAAMAALGLIFFSTAIEAQEFCGDRYCAVGGPVAARPVAADRYVIADRQERIVAHPSGCPRTLFCGCGVSVRVWGHPVRAFYPATAYAKFRRDVIASGNVAWRYRKGGGHAVYIEEALGGTMARVYDPNSGGHKTRIQVLNLAGWHIVNPRSERFASLR